MKKQEAIQLIESTFNNAFDENQFTLFIKNFLNDIDTTKYNEYKGNYIKDAYAEHINQYKRIGKYTDPDGEALDVLIVEVKDQSKLDRARTTLRNFIITHLDNFEKDYALVAFYSKSDGGADWRFSYVKLEYKTEVTEGKLKQKKELTPAKRFSFLVGEHEKAHTAKTQLLPLLQNIYNNPTLAQIEETFSIEAVTDEFFEQYKLLFGKLVEQFEKDKSLQAELETSEIKTDRFAKKLLGQIVFLYFLQKKGWLGVQKDEKWGKGDKKFLQSLYDKAIKEDKNFYGDYLQYLFYEALAKEHNDEGIKGYYAKINSRIPFLNGGLFEADYQWETANISIPNHLFRNNEKLKSGDEGTGILDVFDRYNFTIKEDEPLEKEVAVDPEMLGKVFENMLEVTERKSKGAFYTPREIVHYMCQESLIHYLNHNINDNSDAKPKVPVEDLEEFIRKGFFSLENDLRVLKEGKETKTYKFQLPESVRNCADALDECIANIKICDPAIGSGAFPVGLLLELVNAQLVLRQYLSPIYFSKKLKELGLTQQEFEENETRYTYRLKRHSIQESIYGVDVDASAIDVARLRLWLSLVVDEEDLDNIEALPNLDYKIVCGNSLIGLPETAMRDLKVQEELEKLKEKFFAITDNLKKKELRSTINQKIRQLLDSAEQFSGYKIDFDFKLFFSEVWREKGGFDVVIGNPPYVFGGSSKISNEEKIIFKNNFFSGNQKINLFTLFIEKSIQLLKPSSTLNFIVPNTLLRVTSYSNIREYIVKNTSINEIVDLDVGVFKKVTASTIIIRVSCKKPSTNLVKIKKGITGDVLQKIPQSIFKTKGFVFDIFSNPSDRKILDNLNKNTIPLGKISRYIRFGVVISGNLDEVVSYEKRDDNWKPFLEGDEIGDYKINHNGRFLNYTKELLHRSRTPDVFEESKIMVQRITGGKKPLKAVFDDQKYYNKESIINIILSTKDFSYFYILSLLNSEVLNWFYAKRFTNFSKLTVNLSKEYLSEIPVKLATRNQQQVLEYLTKYLIEINHLNRDSRLLTTYLKNIIDACIYELYFPEEIKASKKEIIKYLHDIKPITPGMGEEHKLSIIQSEFERLYDPNHPVRNAVETMDSVEEIKTIKEALKK